MNADPQSRDALPSSETALDDGTHAFQISVEYLPETPRTLNALAGVKR